MHAGILVVRPPAAHGATQQMLQCDGNIVTSQFVLQVRLKVSIVINSTSLVFQRVRLKQRFVHFIVNVKSIMICYLVYMTSKITFCLVLDSASCILYANDNFLRFIFRKCNDVGLESFHHVFSIMWGWAQNTLSCL